MKQASFGFVEEGLEKVREAFLEAQSTDPGGAQLCIYRDGKCVVDLSAGRDPLNDRPFDRDMLCVVMSATKGAVALCAHKLIDQGRLALDAPVCNYWPEFAAKGKDRILVRHVLNHSAGLVATDPALGLTLPDLFDNERCAAALQQMEPFWTPGAATFYHFVTFGTLVGEIVRRVSGRSVGRFFADEIAGPLKLSFWIGLPQAQEERWVPHFRGSPKVSVPEWRGLFQKMSIDPESRLARALLDTFGLVEDAIDLMSSERALRAAELPAGNGICNARSLAKMYAAMIGEVDGVRVISKETMENARRAGIDGLRPPKEIAGLIRGDPMRFGLGFELPTKARPMLGPGSFGHSGAGGRLGFAHPEHRIAVGYVCNRMVADRPNEPDRRWTGWTEALSRLVSAAR